MDGARSQTKHVPGVVGVHKSSRTIAWVQWAVLAGLLTFVYRDILTRLINQWWADDNYSHGFFVPLFSLFVLSNERKRLAQVPVKPAWTGLIVLAGSLGILIVGVLGAELFLSRTSLIFLAAGLTIFFFGWRMFRATVFPWAVLFLMVPLPAIVFYQIAFPLQLFASQMASSLLEVIGVPAARQGNVILLPTMTLEVVEACSGIRSLVSLGTLAVIYGYFLEPKTVRRFLLVAAAVPIAVVANAFRVTGTGLLGYFWNPDKAEGFFHTFQGWVLFVLSLLLLFLVHRSMSLWDRWRNARAQA